MAKKSSIEKNNRRRRLAKKYSGRRSRLKAIARDKNKPMEERFAATLKLAELPRNSSAHAHPQPLRDDRAGRARYYRKLKLSPHRAARARLQGPDPGPGQVELVRRIDDGFERSARRHDHPHPQRADAQQVEGLDAGLQAARERARRAQDRGLSSAATRRSSTRTAATEFEIELKYFDGAPVIREIARVSKPGRRVYASVKSAAARQQRARRCDPVHAQGRHGRPRRARRQCRRRSPLHGVLGRSRSDQSHVSCRKKTGRRSRPASPPTSRARPSR